jgi:hypothetical protein
MYWHRTKLRTCWCTRCDHGSAFLHFLIVDVQETLMNMDVCTVWLLCWAAASTLAPVKSVELPLPGQAPAMAPGSQTALEPATTPKSSIVKPQDLSDADQMLQISKATVYTELPLGIFKKVWNSTNLSSAKHLRGTRPL